MPALRETDVSVSTMGIRFTKGSFRATLCAPRRECYRRLRYSTKGLRRRDSYGEQRCQLSQAYKWQYYLHDESHCLGASGSLCPELRSAPIATDPLCFFAGLP